MVTRNSTSKIAKTLGMTPQNLSQNYIGKGNKVTHLEAFDLITTVKRLGLKMDDVHLMLEMYSLARENIKAKL